MQVESIDGGNGVSTSDMRTVIRPDGSADPTHDPKLSAGELAELVRAMVRTRVIDDRLAALGADGEVGFLPRSAGREAAVIGAAAALEDGDWIFPTMPDWGAALFRGMLVADLVHRVFGDAQDPLRGHDMPGGLAARALRIASASAPAATHLAHAVGVAYAARLRGDDVVAAAMFDAPEIDAADFHTGLNFAGVMKTPVVFLCRVRRGQGSAVEHAVAYGIEGARCDGSDLLAVVATVREAVLRARRGEGATVVDLVLGGEDDAIERARAHADNVGALDDDALEALRRETEESLASAIDAARRTDAPPAASIFDHVFARRPAHLEAQRDELLAGRRPENKQGDR